MSEVEEAGRIRVETLATLEEARAKLHAWRFLEALKKASDEERAAAARQMLDVALARQSLAAALLADIVQDLRRQEPALKSATTAMEKAVEDLDKVKGVITAIGAVVSVVGKIVSLV